jgi:2-amino-4-hydroxy-6-hydroxymethyldihydropteridine diphosphokinase
LLQFAYLIAFGGNLGDREEFARKALKHLKGWGQLGRQSGWHLTPPLPSTQYRVDDHAFYLNFVFEYFTPHAPKQLYEIVRTIEDKYGHDRTQRWRPRAIDLDLLFCAQCDSQAPCFDVSRLVAYQQATEELVIPHQDVWNRRFLLDMIENELGFAVSALRPESNEGQSMKL